MISVLLWLLLIAFLGVFIYSGYRIFSYYSERNAASNSYNDLMDKYQAPAPTEPSKSTESNDPEAPTMPTEDPGIPPHVDAAGIAAEYEDFTGWLYCPDTVIDYPVVQGENNAYYLHRLIDGTYNYNGCLFIDYRCEPDLAGRNTIIYGHNMRSGIMFGTLQKYKKADYYAEHPVLYLQTPESTYTLEVFAAYTTTHDSRAYQHFEDDIDYMDYIEYAKSKSKFDCDVKILPDDRIVTLSTCAYEFDNARFVVVCKLVPEA